MDVRRGSVGLEGVERALRRVRALAVGALAGQRVLVTLTALVGAVVGLAALDALLRFPEWIRWLHWVLGVSGVVGALVVYVLPALRFRPSLTDVALRVEREKAGERGRLASAVEFARALRAGEMGEGRTSELAAKVVEAEARGWDVESARGLMRVDRLRARGMWFALVVLMTVGAAWVNPAGARVGAMRTLSPWKGVEWPKRTEVVDATGARVQARGSSIALRGVVTKSTRPMGETRVEAEYRVVDEQGRTGPTRRAVLTHQRREEVVGEARGGLFERLVEAEGDWVEYRLSALDDETAWSRVRVVEAPAVESARVVIEPPEYALGGASGRLGARVEAELGSGLDDRAIGPSALSGSRVELRLALNKEVPGPSETGDERAWVERALGVDLAEAGAHVEAEGGEWVVRWQLEKGARVVVRLEDAWGIESAEEAVYRFEALQDAPASAIVAEPASDITALPSALVEVAAEGRDDVGLTGVWAERQVVRRAGSGEKSVPGGALEPEGEPVEWARAALSGGETGATARGSLELWELGVKGGDEVWVWAVATDAYRDASGARAATRSGVRRVRVISEEEFVEEIRSELSGIRRTAIRIDEAQSELMEAAQARGTDRLTRAGQAQVGERLARQGEALERLAERVEQNGLRDEGLARLLRDAGEGTRRAGQSSRSAVEGLEQAAERARREAGAKGAQSAEEMEAARLTEEEGRKVAQDQQQVREELAGLIGSLDAGEDAWATRREIERLLEAQKEAQEALRAAANETAGVEAGALTPKQREALQKVADAQRSMAERAQKLVEEMPSKAEQLSRQDPSAAAGMQRAAQEARAAGVSQSMQQAGEQAQQNQTNEAMGSQERAQKALEQMLEEMERGERTRREQLRRRLASVIESIEGLIGQQEQELTRLADGERVGALAGLDGGMIGLNRNTLAVQDEARGAGRELAGVVNLLGRASEAQVRAIGGLRESSIDVGATRAAEEESLARLKEAKAEAEKVDQNEEEREQQEKRRELRAAYRAMLEREQQIRERTGGLAEVEELTRRDRAAVRALGEEQTSVRVELNALLEKTEELNEAKIFAFTHTRLDDAAGRAAEALRTGEPRGALAHEDKVIALLQGLLRALANDPRADKDDKFSDAAGDSGGGGGAAGGSPPLIPPLAELVLLREMQAQIALETRAMDEATEGRDVEPLSAAQRELAEIGKALIQKMSQGGGGGGAPGGGGQ